MARWIAALAVLPFLAAGCASGKSDLASAVQTQLGNYPDRRCETEASVVSVRVKDSKKLGNTAQATAIVAIKLGGAQTGRSRFGPLISCLALYPPEKTLWNTGETRNVAYAVNFEKRAAAWAITRFQPIGLEERGKITAWSQY